MSDLMSSVSSQIQSAINEAINEQIFPPIQGTLGSVKCTRGGGKFRLGDRDLDPKKPWTADSGPVQEKGLLEVTMRMKT